MPLGLGTVAGRVGQGIRQRKAEDVKLEEILADRLMRQRDMELRQQQMQQQMQIAAQNAELANKRFGLDEAQFTYGIDRDKAARQAAEDAAAGKQRQQVNLAEVRRMGMQGIDSGVTPDAVNRMMFAETGEQLPADIADPNKDLRDYEARKQIDMKYLRPTVGSRDQEWVMRNGQPTPIPKGTARVGDQPYDPVAARQSDAQRQSPYTAERSLRTLQSVDELLPRVNASTVGFGTDLLAKAGGTPARNFRAELETLKSNIITSELTAMREASKTGGALGQVSDKEAAFLSAALGALDPGQSPENFRAQLKKIKDSLQRWNAAQAQQQAQGGGFGRGSGLTVVSIEEVK